MLWKVEPTKSFSAVPADFKNRLNKITNITDGGNTISTQVGNTYKKGGFLGGGTFGKVYDCTRTSDGKKLVMKILEGQNVYSVVKEAIIQIVIVEASRGLSHPEVNLIGPYAPEFYEFAYDAGKNICYLFTEQMRQTTFALVKSRKGYAAETKKVFITLLTQIPMILKDLWTALKFNHRDFKTDNCMYIRDAAGNTQVRLIDFGFSCLEIGSIRLDGGGFNFKHCSLSTRDLSQYLFEIYKYHNDVFTDADQKSILEKLLTFPIGKKPCLMWKKCDAMETWKDTYRFLNSTDIVNPNGDPDVVFNVVMAYSKGEKWEEKLAYVPPPPSVKKPSIMPRALTLGVGPFVAAPGKPTVVPKKPTVKPAAAAVAPAAVAAAKTKKCKSGTILNPASGRCVSSTGEIGRKIMRAAPYDVAKAACPKERPDLNPKTRRCLSSCEPGKERSSKTFRCINKKGTRKAAVKKVVACVKGKERSPLTGRCVKKCQKGFARDAEFRCRSTRKAGKAGVKKTRGKTMRR